MKDHPILTALIFLTFATSFNLEAKEVNGKLRMNLLHLAFVRQAGGEKINELIAKFNERRAAGILAQPRIGRNSGMGGFARPDGAAGLVHYPRVGRSGMNDDFKYPQEFEADPKNHRESVDGSQEIDDQKNFDEDFRKRLLNAIWLDNARFGPKKEHRPSCENQEETGGIFFFSPRDIQKMERQLLHYYSPRSSGDHSR